MTIFHLLLPTSISCNSFEGIVGDALAMPRESLTPSTFAACGRPRGPHPAVGIAGFGMYQKIAHSPDFVPKTRIKNQRSQESL